MLNDQRERAIYIRAVEAKLERCTGHKFNWAANAFCVERPFFFVAFVVSGPLITVHQGDFGRSAHLRCERGKAGLPQNGWVVDRACFNWTVILK